MKTKILLLSLLVLTACTEEHEDLQSWMDSKKMEAKSQVKAPEPPAPVQPVSYPEPTRASPHEFSERRMRSQTGDMPNLNRPKELLENYPLDSVRFAGTIGSGNRLSGLVDVEGHVYTVNVGNYVGQNFGRISKITTEGITVTETVENAEGGWENRHILIEAKTDATATK